MSKHIEGARDFARRLTEVYGSELISAALYGSAARGDYKEGVSDLNLLVVLATVDAAALAAGAPLAREWARAGNPPPLVMSEAEWAGSADVFPVEYSDIRDAHLILHGPDLFASLDVQWEDLRLQVERELKEKKIQLRERYLLAAGSPEEVGTLLRTSFPTFLALFRAALRLLGRPVPADAESVVSSAAVEIGFDPDPWMRVHRARRDGAPVAPAPGDPLIAGYLDGVSRASEWIDGLRPNSGAAGA